MTDSLRGMTALGVAALALAALPALGADDLDRTVLPIHEPAGPAITTLDARDATAPPRFEVTAPLPPAPAAGPGRAPRPPRGSP
jgi:arylsulfatase